jgi:hypothetical protein
MAFLAAPGLMFLMLKAIEFERSALEDPARYAKALVILVIAAVCARWWTAAKANTDGAKLQFEEVPSSEVLVLGLYRDGTLPIEPRPNWPPIA